LISRRTRAWFCKSSQRDVCQPEFRNESTARPTAWRTIGVLECAGAVGVLIGIAVAVLGVLAAGGLVALMIGAIANRVRVHDPVLVIAGDVVVLALVVVTGIAFAV
jgi:hypothetical protein